MNVEIKTTYEVWSAIKKAHPELVVFAVWSSDAMPETACENRKKIFTSYGFRGCENPIMQAESSWDVGENKERLNEIHEYWLCST